MELSIFIAKVLGLYLVVFSMAMFLNAKRFKDIVIEIDKSPALLFFSGILPLIFGVLLIAGHPIWEADWRGIITLIGWLAFMKGLIRLAAPQIAIRFDGKFIKKRGAFKICSIIVLLLGIYLCYVGFIG